MDQGANKLKLEKMKIGLYKDKGGGDQNVIVVDEESNKVLVDYGGGRVVWYGQQEYSTWTFVELDAEPVVLNVEEETVIEQQPNPVQEEQKPKKKTSRSKTKKQ